MAIYYPASPVRHEPFTGRPSAMNESFSDHLLVLTGTQPFFILALVNRPILISDGRSLPSSHSSLRTMAKNGLEFPIEPKIGEGLRQFVYSQLFITPKPPSHSFAGQTVIVTGSNSGLGLESARYFYKLGAAKLILGVRTPSKGEAAKEDIVKSVGGRKDGASVIEVWNVDVGSTGSVLAFVQRMKDLPRVDVLLCNAGVNHKQYQLDEGIERSMQINVLNTFLFALSSLPKLRETKAQFPDSSPHITIVSSDAYRLTKFVEINTPDIYEAFNDRSTFNGQARYQDSKLLQVLVLREVVKRLAKHKSDIPPITFNLVSPGLCVTNIDNKDGKYGLGMRLVHKVFYRTTEVGARTLVHATYAGPETHGGYLVDQRLPELESWILTDMGQRAQLKAYEQTMAILEKRKPGIASEARI
ncbi:NAD(P)-binding protein [Xylaria castorea]|nr:NAD(P)-binding protein [Xylaria castorea]